MSNSKLPVEEYNRFEKLAITQMPNKIIEAFQPTCFNQDGYPTQVEKEKDLWKYLDTMQELRFHINVELFLGGLTKNEFALVKNLTKKIMLFF